MALVAAGLIWIWHSDSQNEGDPAYEIIAVAWEPGIEPLYQAVVKARHVLKSGNYEITADILMGPSKYTVRIGILGTVGLKRQALEKFGVIRWSPDEVTFGSETSVSASMKRSELENHR